MFVLLGVWAAQNVTGIVLGKFANGTASTSVYGYQVALTVGCSMFFAVAFVIGLLAIKETNCKRSAFL
jgi:hypothetical protein